SVWHYTPIYLAYSLLIHSFYQYFSSCDPYSSYFFLFTAPAPSEIYTLSLHDALPISCRKAAKIRLYPRFPEYSFPPPLLRECFRPLKWRNCRPICLENCCGLRNIFRFSTSLPMRRR